MSLQRARAQTSPFTSRASPLSALPGPAAAALCWHLYSSLLCAATATTLELLLFLQHLVPAGLMPALTPAKDSHLSPGSVAQVVERPPMHQEVPGSIPCLDHSCTGGRRSMFFSLFSSPSLSKIKIYSMYNIIHIIYFKKRRQCLRQGVNSC